MQNCQTCASPKANLTCGLCQESVCKSCAQFTEDDAFSFLPQGQIPADLKHHTYCPACFDAKVAAPYREYQATLEKARDTLVFMKKQGKETRLIRRIEKPVTVKDCPDHDETILRLAFFAAKAGFNAIIDVDLHGEKIRNASYQTMRWSGTGVPANVQDKELVKDRSIWQNPN